MRDFFEKCADHVVRCVNPASEWVLGHPVGNGRVGAMVMGRVRNERVSLNHDLLWRRFLTWQDKNAAGLLPEVRRLCAQGKWDEAQDLFLTRIPETSNAIYINPFVPFCDLGLFMRHRGGEETAGYERTLDMDAGVARVGYDVGRRRYRRECFCPYGQGLLLVRLTCSVAGSLSGEVSLSRLLDPDCAVTGSSGLGSLTLEGEFEEGVAFAAGAKVFQRGGRLTGGISAYAPPAGGMPPKDLNNIEFTFRDETRAFVPCGVTTCFDSADEVLVAVALATGDESDRPPAELCRRRLAALGEGFPDAEALLLAHARDHREWFRRSGIHIAGGSDTRDAEALLARTARGEGVDNALYGLLYDMGRYLAIASGRPQPEGAAPKAPINLQGLWNQDRRPAWDCDYHLDLNLEMCYWGLDAMNLGELMRPLMEWAIRLLPQGRRAAADLYGCRGAWLSFTCDNKTVGNPDNMGYCVTSTAAWVAQALWIHSEYSRDEAFLREELYPFMKELAAFYDDFLTEDGEGRLITCPSGSPEMGIAGRKEFNILSSMSAFDMELIRELYGNLCAASDALGLDRDKRDGWRAKLERLPLPPLLPGRGLCEWLEPHEPYDVGHRHRSHLVGIVPGNRITVEDTPEYARGVRDALEYRNSRGAGSSLSLTSVMDAMAYARIYDAGKALEQLDATVYYNVMENLLMALCDWRSRGETLVWFGGRRLFQIEAGIGIACSIAEMIVQDRRGVIRLLPALPASWPQGNAFGIRARGGFEVSVEWENGRILSAAIHSALGGVCRVMPFHAPGGVRVLCGGREIPFAVQGDAAVFDTVRDMVYNILPCDGPVRSGKEGPL